MLGDFLIHIGSDLNPLSCFGINLPLMEVYELLEVLKIKDRVVCKDRHLRIYGSYGIKSIDLNRLSIMDLNVKKVSSNEWLKPMNKALRALELEKQIGIKQCEEFQNVINILQNPKSSLSEQKNAIRFLLGRGLGLTPSGDDMLMGYGTGLSIMGKEDNFFNILGEVLDKQTTDISIAYLNAMLEGYVNEDYNRMNTAINKNSIQKYDELLREIQKVGHTSGNDSLFGFHISVKYLLGEVKNEITRISF